MTDENRYPFILKSMDKMTCCIMMGMGILAFWNTWSADFVWDDTAAVRNNPDVTQQHSPWMDLFHHDFWGVNISAATSHKSYRPLTVLTFRWNYQYGSGRSDIFHITNILLHACTTGLVYATSLRILQHDWSSILSTILFAVHPIHCDAVASIVGRADVMCTFFSLCAFLVHDTALHLEKLHFWKPLGLFCLSLILILAAALSKELGIMTVAVLMVAEYTKNTDVCVYSRSRVSIMILFSVVFLYWRLSLHGLHMLFPWSSLENHLSHLPWGTTRILSTAYTHAIYLYKLVWPRHLSYDYGYDAIPLIEDLNDTRNIETALAYTVVFYALWQSISKPVWRMAVAWAVFPFIPASNVLFPVGTIVAERLLYFPSVGFFMAVGHVMGKIPTRTPVLVLILLLMSCLLSRTLLRNEEWKTEKQLFKASLESTPRSVKVLSNYAKMLLTPKEAASARVYLQEAVQLYPYFATGHFNLGLAHIFLGNSLSAIQYLSNALEITPGNAVMHGFLGETYLHLSLKDEECYDTSLCETLYIARLHLQVAWEDTTTASHYPSFWYSKGLLENRQGGNFNEVIDSYAHALLANQLIEASGYSLERMISYGSLYDTWAQAYLTENRSEEAFKIYAHGRQHVPDAIELYNNAAIALTAHNRFKEALLLYHQALVLEPQSAILYTNAGYTAQSMKDYPSAYDYYARAYFLDPQHPQIQNNYNTIRRIMK